MTRTQIILAVVAGSIGPFAFAWFINALYVVCLSFGWGDPAAGLFATMSTIIGWGCAIAVTIVGLAGGAE